MEQAAVHRMAKSIAQLTLCQVTSEEIETATKLLKKRATSPGASQKFRPSESLMLTMQRANCINLVAFWKVALSQRAMKSVKHRKLCCYCPVLKKDLARLRKSTMPTYRTQLTTMTFLSTRDPLRDAEDRQSTPERNLSCL